MLKTQLPKVTNEQHNENEKWFILLSLWWSLVSFLIISCTSQKITILFFNWRWRRVKLLLNISSWHGIIHERCIETWFEITQLQKIMDWILWKTMNHIVYTYLPLYFIIIQWFIFQNFYIKLHLLFSLQGLLFLSGAKIKRSDFSFSSTKLFNLKIETNVKHSRFYLFHKIFYSLSDWFWK